MKNQEYANKKMNNMLRIEKLLLLLGIFYNIYTEHLHSHVRNKACFKVRIIAAVLQLLFVVRVMLYPLINVLYFDVSTFRSICAVFSMAVFCSSLISCLSNMLPRYMLSDFETHPVDPIVTGITCFYI